MPSVLLMARGWIPPNADRSPASSDAAPVPAATLPGFSASSPATFSSVTLMALALAIQVLVDGL